MSNGVESPEMTEKETKMPEKNSEVLDKENMSNPELEITNSEDMSGHEDTRTCPDTQIPQEEPDLPQDEPEIEADNPKEVIPGVIYISRNQSFKLYFHLAKRNFFLENASFRHSS